MTVLEGRKVGDEAWWLHHVIGPGTWPRRDPGSSTSRWTSTTGRSSYDLMRICTDWLTGFYRRLGETGIHSISMNETTKASAWRASTSSSS